MKVQTYGEGGYDPSKPNNNIISEKEVALAPDQENRQTIEQRAVVALQANRDFIASTPTAAQTAAQVKALTKQMNGIIRLLLNQLDGTD